MSGAGAAEAVRGESPLPGGRKRELPVVAGLAQPILKDVGEIHSRLLDHRPVIQGEIRYFVKEFEEKRGLRELRVLESLKNMIYETNNQILPKCEQVMHDSLNEAFKRLQAASQRIHKLQEREQGEREVQTDKLMAGEKQRTALWEAFLEEQQNKQAEVDEEHRKAMERLKQQYVDMEKDLAKYVSF
ncbi:biogenesis of lysosome-related organelles complex 1 subunit 5 isoform X2 [Alligator mississippiensis]|uniref:Biogenesis of lysosome-related organelles complex 1 subunit 5 n=1 Tax=Alligator mississippiensis TaxID=8496 RepID=A0A151NCZ0_ALLMI|nr:biogenesis of lysosome-related organelles complex 1 subunit 5 isoform X2 [Alligator mississippiensis]KYO34684.1 biogenesis of lysosome-related organelles complex 1 subunit 5 [Alligator mississippiensis]